MSKRVLPTDPNKAAGTSASRSSAVRAAAIIALALVVLIAALGLVTLEPGDNYCGRVLVPRHESIVACDQALDDQRRTMAVVASAGVALLAVTWMAGSRKHPGSGRTWGAGPRRCRVARHFDGGRRRSSR